MIDLKALRENPARFAFGAKAKNVHVDIDKLLQLDEKKLAILRDILDGVLTDAFYTLLLGLDGAASIGGLQQCFDLRDESGDKIGGDGELEAAAYSHFHET